MKQIYLAASVLIAAVAGATGAALSDGAPSYDYAPAHAQVSNPWNGLYVGLHGGYAWQDVDGIFNGGGAPTALSGIDLNGGDHRRPARLQLAERPVPARHRRRCVDTRQRRRSPRQPGLPGAATLGADMNYLASIRGRLGWAINNWLLYGTRRLGLFSVRIHRERAQHPVRRQSQHLDDSGIVYGGGVEWMLAYGVSLRGEYLRYDLGASSALPAGFPSVDPGDGSPSTTSTWRGRR